MNDDARSEDMAWDALLATAREIAPDLGEEFLRKVYEIQRRHQFSRDRSESLMLLDNLVESELGGRE